MPQAVEFSVEDRPSLDIRFELIDIALKSSLGGRKKVELQALVKIFCDQRTQIRREFLVFIIDDFANADPKVFPEQCGRIDIDALLRVEFEKHLLFSVGE